MYSFLLLLLSGLLAIYSYDQSSEVIPRKDETRILPSNNQANLNCDQFRNKTLIDIEHMFDRNITLLISYPGAGNTWVRLLIESVTGVLTGSVYTKDESLEKIFEGEDRCGVRLSVVKGHPFSFDPCGDYLCLTNGPRDMLQKCKRGMIPNFKKFIFVARNPMKTFVAEFQRFLTMSHNATGIPRITKYVNARFKGTSSTLAQEMSYGWDNKIYPMMKRYTPDNFLVLKYENLLDKATRMEELRRVPTFLGFPLSEERLQCAFGMSESDSIHRKSKVTYDMIIKADDTTYQCNIWRKIERISGNFSYPHPWPGLNCTGIV